MKMGELFETNKHFLAFGMLDLKINQLRQRLPYIYGMNQRVRSYLIVIQILQERHLLSWTAHYVGMVDLGRVLVAQI